MLEIISHQYLKEFVKTNDIKWQHIYSFGRIISKCLKTNDNYLINSEIFLSDNWLPAILIALFLHEKNTTLVMSKENIKYLKQKYLPLLEKQFFYFHIQNDVIIFPKHQIFLITLDELVKKFNDSNFYKQRLVLTEINNIKEDLKLIFRISLTKKNWLEMIHNHPNQKEEIFNTYNALKKNFFLKSHPKKKYVSIDKNEIKILFDLFSKYSFCSSKFAQVKKALMLDWVSFVELDFDNFEWIFNIEPVDEISEIKELLNENFFIFLSSQRRDISFVEKLKKYNFKIDLSMNFKSNFIERKILIYTPQFQKLPNEPSFFKTIVDKCSKLILFRNGFSVILTDEKDFKMRLATELASIHGQKVLLESIPKINYQVLISSYSWWIENLHSCDIPEQIIVPLIPIPSISDPINEITVSYYKKKSKDWFREYLLPEAIEKIDKAVSPLRRNAGKLVILDGRISRREWGKKILKSIQPSENIHYIFPFE